MVLDNAELGPKKFSIFSFNLITLSLSVYPCKFSVVVITLCRRQRVRGAASVAEKFQKISNFFFEFFNTELVFAKVPH